MGIHPRFNLSSQIEKLSIVRAHITVTLISKINGLAIAPALAATFLLRLHAFGPTDRVAVLAYGMR